ncbi:hypothetical protein ACWEPZ_21090 [Streptomyces sp. NPDC004288]
MAPVVDLTAALEDSVAKAKAPATVHKMPKPKKTAAKKGAVKKPAAKRTTGRRPPAAVRSRACLLGQPLPRLGWLLSCGDEGQRVDG